MTNDEIRRAMTISLGAELPSMLAFDPATERHTGDHAEAANALLKDPNSKGFEVPDPARV